MKKLVFNHRIPRGSASEDISLFDRDMNFVIEPGIFAVMVGSSSQDIRLRGEFDVKYVEQ